MDDLYAFTRASGLPLSLNTSVKTFFRNSRCDLRVYSRCLLDCPIRESCRRIRAERRYQFLLDHMSPGLRSAVMAETYELWLCAVPFFDFKRNTVRGQRPEITAAVEKEGHEFMRALAAAVELLAFPPLEAILWPHQETSAMCVPPTASTFSLCVSPSPPPLCLCLPLPPLSLSLTSFVLIASVVVDVHDDVQRCVQPVSIPLYSAIL